MSYYCLFSKNKKLKLEILADCDAKFAVPRKMLQNTLIFLQEYFQNTLEIESSLNAACRFVSKNEMINLNTEYRKINNKVSNVLSFPVFDIKNVTDFKFHLNKNQEDDYCGIGDVMICCEVIEEECKLTKENFKDRFVFLIVHSMLHLIGMRHGNESEADKMESVEKMILENVYIGK